MAVYSRFRWFGLRRMGKFLFIASLLLVSACADETQHSRIDLRGTWKIEFADRPEFKARDFVDEGWQQIAVPGSWTLVKDYAGVAWYRKEFILPPDFPLTNRAIAFIAHDADEMFLNGHLIGKSGVVEDARSYAYGIRRIYYMPSEYLYTGRNVLAVRVRGVFPKFSGLTQGSFEISNLHQLERERAREEVKEVALAAIYLAAGLYFLTFFLRLPGIRAHLFFSIFCIMLSFYMLARSTLLVDVFDFLAMKRAEYCVLFLLPIPFLAFWTTRFQQSIPLPAILYSLFFMGILYVPLSTDDVVKWSAVAAWFHVATIPGILYVLYFLLRNAFRGSREARVLLLGTLVFIATVINDMLDDRRIILTVRMAQYGFLVLVTAMATSLIQSFVELQEQSRQTLRRLTEMDQLKERMVANVTQILLEPVALILSAVSRLKSRETKLASDYQELHDHGVTLNEALDGVLLLSRIQSGVEGAAIRVMEGDELTRIFPGFRWPEVARIAGTETLLKTLFEIVSPGRRSIAYHRETGLSLIMTEQFDSAGSLRENLLSEIVRTLQGTISPIPNGSRRIIIPAAPEEAAWADRIESLARSKKTTLLRLIFAALFFPFLLILGATSFAAAQLVYFLVSLTFALNSWLPGAPNSWRARLAASATAAYVRSFLDVAQIAIMVHFSGGLNSPLLVGLAVPTVLGALGADPWRGRWVAIVATVLAIGSEVVTTLGYLPDANILAQGPTPGSVWTIVFLGGLLGAALGALATLTNRLFVNMMRAREEADKRRKDAERISDVTRALNASTDFSSLMDQIVDHLQFEFLIDSMILLLPEPGTGELVVAQASTLPGVDPRMAETARRLRVAVGAEGGIVRATFERKKPLSVRVTGPRDIFRKQYPGVEGDRSFIEDLELEWFLLVPLVIRGESIGIVLFTSYSRPHGLNKQEINAVEEFCNHAAGAIYSSSLLANLTIERDAAQLAREEAEKAREETQKLSQFARKINATTNLAEILDEVFTYIKTAFNAQDILLQLVDESKMELHTVKCTTNRGPADLEFAMNLRVPLDERGGTLYRTYRKQKPFYAHKLQGFPTELDEEITRRLRLESLAQFPLVIQDKTIGIIWLSFGSERRTRSVIESIGRFCDQIAGAIGTARMLGEMELARVQAESARQDAQDAAAEVTALNDIARQIQESTGDLDGLIDQAFAYLNKQFGLEAMAFAVPSADGTHLKQLRIWAPALSAEQSEWLAELDIPLNDSGGTLYRSFRRQRPFFLARTDVAMDYPIDREIVSMLNLRSLLHVPLVVKDQCVGIFWCTSYSQQLKLSKEKIRRIQGFCDQIASAIHTARLLTEKEEARAESERARAETEVLAELARKANSGQSIEEILPAVAEATREKFGVDRVGFFLVDLPGNRFALPTMFYDAAAASFDSYPDVPREIPIAPESGTILRTYLRKRPFHLPRINKEWLQGSPVDGAVQRGLKFEWFAQIPLLIKDEVIGILLFAGPEPRKLSRADLLFCERLAAQLAGAVRGLELLRQASQARAAAELAAAELQQLSEITRQINSHTDLDAVLDNVFDYIMKQYNVNYCGVYLVDKERDELYGYRARYPLGLEDKQAFFMNFRLPLSDRSGLVMGIRRGRAFYVPDLSAIPLSPLEKTLTENLKLQSLMFIPLKLHGKLVGVVNLTNFNEPMHLTQDQVRSVAFFGEQIAGAIAASNLLKEVQTERERAERERVAADRSRQQSDQLAAISRQLNENPDLMIIANLAIEFMTETYDVEKIGLLLVNEREEKIEVVAHRGFAEGKEAAWVASLELPLNPGSGAIYRTYKTRKPLYLRRIPPSSNQVDTLIVSNLGLTKNILHLPLVVQGRTVGIILAGRSAEAQSITRTEVSNMQAFADQIAGGIRTTKLLAEVIDARRASEKLRQESERARVEIEVLAEISRKANQATNLGELCTHVASVLKDMYGSDRTVLYTLDADETRLELRAILREGSLIDPETLSPLIRSVPLVESSGTLFQTWRRSRTLYITGISRRPLELAPIDKEIVKAGDFDWFVQVPLKIENSVVAILSFSGPARERLGRKDLQFCERLAAQISGTVRASELLRQTEEARRDVERMAEVTRHINENADLSAISQGVFGYIRDRFGLNRFVLLLCDDQAREIRSVAVLHDTSREFWNGFSAPLVPETGSLYRTYARKKPLYVDRFGNERHSLVDSQIIEKTNLKAFVHIPLVVQDKTVGIVLADADRRLSRKEIAAIARTCDQIAGAVQNAQLLAETNLARAQAEAARVESDRILANIFPASIAEELKHNGRVEPLFYDSVSVLFTDFVGFTQASEGMLPDELVAELDGCFSQFDEVVRRNKMEKLKTIGDSYMCAAGLPLISDTHAIDACLTALEFRSFMITAENIKKSMGLSFWQIRIGIHSGPVTAGVIGTNKFAYDIWGDTVNTASRMESSSAPGMVNISGDTYALVKDFFDCEYRGKVKAKGKGEIDMYFVNRIKPELSADEEGLLPNAKFEVMRLAIGG
ncbi:MAG: GAF domain-containing protein [Leptospirales bacterium]|nr:GAF domain-containing protein [Leptospirales bacterium]